MLVYRAVRHRIAPAAALAGLIRELDRVAAAPAHDALESLLVECGDLEAGLADALSPEADGFAPPLPEFRAATCGLARALRESWHGRTGGIRPALAGARRHLAAVAAGTLPERIELSVPEGFAYYGLHLETYLEAAERFAVSRPGSAAVCLGLRGIGATLGAAVSAALEACGWTVESLTLRPRGHPFDRRPVLAPTLAQWLAARRERRFLVVDEGPGLSGSSFAGVVETLEALGVPHRNVVLFPSWDPEGPELRSPAARRRWPALERRPADFERTWIASGRLARSFAAGRLIDLSAGRWRAHWLPPGAAWPAVHPQHERRKYLAPGRPARLIRFAGLGRRGAALARRAAELAEAGFGPRPLGLAHGFLALGVIPGSPVRERHAPAALLDTAARYLAHLKREYPCDPGAGAAELVELAAANTAEALGEDWGERARAALLGQGGVWDAGAVALDGRMMAHEWIRTREAYLKTDALDHHDDHFYPGPQDVAWDLAGACVELGLPREAERYLLERYAAVSGDRDAARRLPAYRVAYLAVRVGYATLAMQALALTPEGQRFRRAVARYAARLRGALATWPVHRRPRRPGAGPYDLVIFDADDTLRRTTAPGRPCPLGPDEWELRPGVQATLHRLRAAGAVPRIGIASNQDRVGYGQVSREAAERLLHDLAVRATGAPLPADAVQLCPHRPEERCGCRKPEPGMLRRIMAFYGVPPERTLFVGDAETDREAARRAGTGFMWAREFFGPGPPDQQT